MTSGKLQLEHLVTHHFNLDTVEEAFRTALSGQAIKVSGSQRPTSPKDDDEEVLLGGW